MGKHKTFTVTTSVWPQAPSGAINPPEILFICGVWKDSSLWDKLDLILLASRRALFGKTRQPVLIYPSVVVFVFVGRTSSRLAEGIKDERVNGALTDGAAFLVACNPGGYPGQPGV